MLCKCGCGEVPPPSGKASRPRIYVPGHRQYSQDAMASRAATEGEEAIDIEVFAEKLRKIKAEKGYSWRQMSQLTGRSISHISSLALAKGTKKRIRQSTVDDILRRLAGESLLPTPFQLREYKERADQITRSLRAETIRKKKIDDRLAKFELLTLRLGASQDQSAQDQ